MSAVCLSSAVYSSDYPCCAPSTYVNNFSPDHLVTGVPEVGNRRKVCPLLGSPS